MSSGSRPEEAYSQPYTDLSGTIPVVFVRHGQSTWNKANRFIGWTDTELTEDGIIEAQTAGKLLREAGYQFDEVYTSYLKRAIKTTWIVLDEIAQHYIPVISDWRLNERSYGDLVGRFKKQCVEEYGVDQVKTWRRSYDIPPPPMDTSNPLFPGNDPRYDHLPREWLPLSESLEDTSRRSLWFWEEQVLPAIKAGKRVLISGHENNLRSLLMHLDQVPPEEIRHVELPRAVPLVYALDPLTLTPIKLDGAAPWLSGRYLGDPDQLKRIMERDVKQVYDTSVKENLELTEKILLEPSTADRSLGKRVRSLLRLDTVQSVVMEGVPRRSRSLVRSIRNLALWRRALKTREEEDEDQTLTVLPLLEEATVEVDPGTVLVGADKSGASAAKAPQP
eukprot:CAMPEP_0113934724 /NCGR_PEP_ID=MMETSP1339-20121228/2004_1 /TAXON_ID=94617 /ORGANISM="Fibrocapsa japonica" /LENGTH=390 /DNA_ID=CAMNT_0000936639 /DNA_START=225 /DNA_END=1397 /DNA_ORIENTATION=+ /assembly_acc=CAM_ASM_000762